MGRGRGSDEDLRQQYGFFFEACKQLTTLNTAAALVVLALNREAGLYLWPLMFFGISLAGSTWGMLAVALKGTNIAGISTATNGLVVAAITFVAGLFTTFAGTVG